MKLITIARAGGVAGAELGEEVLDFGLAAAVLPAAARVSETVRDIIRGKGLEAAFQVVNEVGGGPAALRARLRDVAALTPLRATLLLAPIPVPNMIFSHGQAYHSHLRDWDRNAPTERSPLGPVGFIKANSAVVGPGGAIRIPAIAPDMVDFEGEVSVVFGKTCHGVSRDEAMDYVFGYTIINDVSARDWVPKMREPGARMNQLRGLNAMYKSFPTFCPFGPNITTKDEIADYRNLRLITKLNGQVMQDAPITDLIWDVPELIERYSGIMAFEPGDVMTTGTPGGVGAGRSPPIFMKPGDTVAITVPGVGTLENPVVG